MEYQGKAVLITGAASGVGAATAELFASRGAAVVLADLNEAGVRARAAELQARFGVSASAVAYDAASPEAAARLVERAIEAMGKIDVLCNVAGILDGGHSESFADEAWDRVIRVNLSGPFYLAKRALPHLLRTRGCIVSIASAAGLVGTPYSVAYSASKAGVIAMTKSLAVEYAAKGVRVNAICPGAINTPMIQSTYFDDTMDAGLMVRLNPLTGRWSEPAEIAAAIAYLASDAAINITGTILTVDGGQTAA